MARLRVLDHGALCIEGLALDHGEVVDIVQIKEFAVAIGRALAGDLALAHGDGDAQRVL